MTRLRRYLFIARAGLSALRGMPIRRWPRAVWDVLSVGWRLSGRGR